jgi:demethylmenaquinone methyltransferase/2-methoxy-6-polyprenyl-1,4-benzoquinol methylase
MTSLDEKIAGAGRQTFVNSVFDRVAQRYDLMNDLMSGGMHRLWKDAMISWLAPSPSTALRLLDVAGGTGDIARRFLRAAGPGSTAVICDINDAMMRAGREAAARKRISHAAPLLVQGDAVSLPFAGRSFGAYTIAFGIRNVPDISSALQEAFRVLKPGGRFLCLEFSQVTMPMLDRLYAEYSDRVIPAMGRAVAGDAEPYRYLVESIRRFPDQTAFAKLIETAGFSRVQFRNLSGGIAAMHSAIKA